MASDTDRLSAAPDRGDRRRRRNLVPADARRALPWLLLATVVLVGGIGLLTAGGDTPVGPDNFIDRMLYDHRGHFNTEGYWVGNITEVSHIVTLVVIVLLVCAVARSARAALTFLIGMGVDGLLVESIKDVVKRKQGPYGAYTFPSGHTAGATVLAAVIILLCWPGGPLGRYLSPRARQATTAFAVFIVLFVGGMMILMQDHYFTDCLASVPLGATVTVVVGIVIDWIANRLPPARNSRRAST